MPTASHQCVAAILKSDGKVLLCHRHPDREWFPDVWDLPGGHLWPGESPSAALVRELHEELGILLDPPQGAPLAVLHDDEHSVELTIWVLDYDGPVTNGAPSEHDELRWVKGTDLAGLRLADPAYLPILEQVLVGRSGLPLSP